MLFIRASDVNLDLGRDSTRQALNDSEVASDFDQDYKVADLGQEKKNVHNKSVYDTVEVENLRGFTGQLSVIKNGLFLSVTFALCSVYFVVTGI